MTESPLASAWRAISTRRLAICSAIMSPTTEFGWVAWSPQYDSLVDLSRMPDLLYGACEGVKVALPLEVIVRRIDITARENGIALTQHSLVIERASTYAKHVDDAMTAMQKAGVLKQFNQAYRKHRIESARKGESATPVFVPCWAICAPSSCGHW